MEDVSKIKAKYKRLMQHLCAELNEILKNEEINNSSLQKIGDEKRVVHDQLFAILSKKKCLKEKKKELLYTRLNIFYAHVLVPILIIFGLSFVTDFPFTWKSVLVLTSVVEMFYLPFLPANIRLIRKLKKETREDIDDNLSADLNSKFCEMEKEYWHLDEKRKTIQLEKEIAIRNISKYRGYIDLLDSMDRFNDNNKYIEEIAIDFDYGAKVYNAMEEQLARKKY